MDKKCVTCQATGIYKCPTCLVYYCSVQCCKEHRKVGCDVIVKQDDVQGNCSIVNQTRYSSADTVPMEKLLLLKTDATLKQLLSNPHLRDLLLTINSSNDPERIMQMAMQEPLFVEFADACLKIVEPPTPEDS